MHLQTVIFDVDGLMLDSQHLATKAWRVVESDVLPTLPFVRQPSRHLFAAAELETLLANAGCRVLETTSWPSLVGGLRGRLEEIAEDPVAWASLLELEKRASLLPGLADAGEHILAAAELRGSTRI